MMYTQCAWCGLCQDGPYEGSPQFEVTSDGYPKVFLLEGYTHGICDGCDARVFDFRKLKKLYNKEAVLCFVD